MKKLKDKEKQIRLALNTIRSPKKLAKIVFGGAYSLKTRGMALKRMLSLFRK
jgi:hypothetical protein